MQKHTYKLLISCRVAAWNAATEALKAENESLRQAFSDLANAALEDANRIESSGSN